MKIRRRRGKWEDSKIKKWEVEQLKRKSGRRRIE